MKTIYEIIGIIVFWFLIGWGSRALFWYYLYEPIKKVLTSDPFQYYIMRKTVDTKDLRNFYLNKTIMYIPRLKHWVLKFRLRNIKRARK